MKLEEIEKLLNVNEVDNDGNAWRDSFKSSSRQYGDQPHLAFRFLFSHLSGDHSNLDLNRKTTTFLLGYLEI